MMTENKSNNLFEDHYQNSISCNRFKYVLIRISFIGVLVACIFLNTIYGFLLPQSNIDCVVDYTFIWTHHINTFFSKNKLGKHMLIIISSLLVDLIFISSAYLWIAYGKSWRFVFALLLFYSSDIIMQIIFQIRAPDGYLIEYPGFPSITVSYMSTMFYPSQIGLLAIVSLESWKINNKYMCAVCIASLILQILTRNFLRGNYIIDIFTALVVAHYLFILADDICPKYFDNVNNEWFKLNTNAILDIDYYYSDIKIDEDKWNEEKLIHNSFGNDK